MIFKIEIWSQIIRVAIRNQGLYAGVSPRGMMIRTALAGLSKELLVIYPESLKDN